MRIDIPEKKVLAFQTQFPIRWGDMDAFGHVNNVQFVQYLENVRVDWLQSMRYLAPSNGEGVVVVNVFCNFYQQLLYPGDLLAKLYLTAVSRRSFDHVITFERADAPGTIVAAGGAALVWVNFAQGKALPLPDGLAAALAAIQEPQA
jgi:acyl-CoA thioester hydrolase